VAAGEEQDRDEADSGPDIAVLDDGKDIGPGNNGSRNSSRKHHGGEDPLDPVDRAPDGRVRAVGEVAAEPGMDLLGALGAVQCKPMAAFKSYSTHPFTKSYRIGSGETAAWGPVVGGKRNRTGAVWRPSWDCQRKNRIARKSVHTLMKISLPSEKSRVARTRRDSPALSPLIQLFDRRSHSGWNSRHSWHPNRESSAVRRIAAV
jgi:hypothetical protein